MLSRALSELTSMLVRMLKLAEELLLSGWLWLCFMN